MKEKIRTVMKSLIYRQKRKQKNIYTCQIWRQIKNYFFLSFSLFAIIFGLFWLLWIIIITIKCGFNGISVATFSEMTPPPNSTGGGLANALVGSAIIILLATIISTPFGVLAGIYLVEYGRRSLLSEIISFVNDILLSVPSILIGLFIYSLLVIQIKHFSGLTSVIALTLLQIPIIIHTTENIMRLIPDTLREAAYALGTPKWKMILSITLKASLSGILTGILLSISRIAGETAPMLFTSLSNQFWSVDLMKPIANLPITIFKFAMSPFIEWQKLAWAGVLIITLSILFLNIIAKIIFIKRKY